MHGHPAHYTREATRSHVSWSSLHLTLEVSVYFTGRAPRRGVGGWGRKNPSSRVAAGRWSGASWARSESGALQCVYAVEAQGTSGVTWRDALWLYNEALLHNCRLWLDDLQV